MTKKETGGAAFPKVYAIEECYNGKDKEVLSEPGMTLRDYFAAKAMQGFLSNTKAMMSFITRENNTDVAVGDLIAKDSYFMADTMIKIRDEK